MRTNIYYFSASGNSLSFARKMAKRLNTENLYAISELVENKEIFCEADRIGIVCPVYAWGLPRIVAEFLEKLHIQGRPYIFAIVSCVGIAGKTTKAIQKQLRQKEQDLHAGFVIKAPCGSLAKKNALDKIVIGMDRKRKNLKTGDERLDEIVNAIQSSEVRKPETSSPLANHFGEVFHEHAEAFFKNAAKDFVVSEKCIGCGNCVRLCPRANIILEDGKPRFSDNCEFCHACMQWCPEFALTHPRSDPALQQYRNPEVRLNDMVVNV